MHHARVLATFAAQPFMAHLGARLVHAERGVVELEVARGEALLQHTGVLHAGVLTSLLDTACGCAALTVMADDATVVSVEFKVNLVAAAAGERFLVRGEVLSAGRTIVVCRGEAHRTDGGAHRLVAAMQATMMTVSPRA